MNINGHKVYMLRHKPIDFEAVTIGGQRITVSAKTASLINYRRKKLKRRDERISREMREARLLPSETVTNGRHASYISSSNTRKHKPENMISLSQAKHAGIEAEYKQYIRNEARKYKLI
jgi:hypothetical protein